MRPSIVIRLGDQEASQEMNLKTRVNIITWKQIVSTPVLMPIMAKIQQETIQVPRSTGCQLSWIRDCLGNLMIWWVVLIPRSRWQSMMQSVVKFPQIQSVLNAGSGQSTLNKWTVPSERPEVNSEETYGEKAKKSNRSEQRFDYQNGSQPNLRAYDSRSSRKK